MLSVILIGAGVIVMGLESFFFFRTVDAGMDATRNIYELRERLHRVRELPGESREEVKRIEQVLIRLEKSGLPAETGPYLEELKRKIGALDRLSQNPAEYAQTVDSAVEDLRSINALLHKGFYERVKRYRQYWVGTLILFFGIPAGISLVALVSATKRSTAGRSQQNVDVCTDSLPVPVIRVSKEGIVVYVNREFLQWSGYEDKECRGRRLDSFVEKTEHHRVTDLLEELSRGKTIRGVQVRFLKKDGFALVELDGAGLDNSDGDGVVVLKDIESIKKVMRELEGARKRAEEAKEKLKKMVNELEEFALIAIRREMKLKEIKERILTEDKKH